MLDLSRLWNEKKSAQDLFSAESRYGKSRVVFGCAKRSWIETFPEDYSPSMHLEGGHVAQRGEMIN